MKGFVLNEFTTSLQGKGNLNLPSKHLTLTHRLNKKRRIVIIVIILLLFSIRI